MSLNAAIEQVGLTRLTGLTRGKGQRIGLVDGMIDWGAPELATTRRGPDLPARGCRRCAPTVHGTFMAKLLTGRNGLCPEATLVFVPVFGAEEEASRVSVIAEAILTLLEAGVDVINISLGLSAGGIEAHPDYLNACVRAERHGVPIVVAAGNQAQIGPVPLAAHPWVIPVGACQKNGEPDPLSNLGPSIATNGVRAPGWALAGMGAHGGTSQAAGFVSAALALLLTALPGRSGSDVRSAVLAMRPRRTTIIPPLLNADAAYRRLAP